MAKAMEVHEMASLKTGPEQPSPDGNVPNSNNRGSDNALKEKTKVKVTSYSPWVFCTTLTHNQAIVQLHPNFLLLAYVYVKLGDPGLVSSVARYL